MLLPDSPSLCWQHATGGGRRKRWRLLGKLMLSAWSNDSPCKCIHRALASSLHYKCVWYFEKAHRKCVMTEANFRGQKFRSKKWPITVFLSRKAGNQCSPRGQVEVSVDCHASALLPLLASLLLLLLLLPHSCDKESQFGCQGNRLFPRRCWNTWEGQGGFVSPPWWRILPMHV